MANKDSIQFELEIAASKAKLDKYYENYTEYEKFFPGNLFSVGNFKLCVDSNVQPLKIDEWTAQKELDMKNYDKEIYL